MIIMKGHYIIIAFVDSPLVLNNEVMRYVENFKGTRGGLEEYFDILQSYFVV